MKLTSKEKVNLEKIVSSLSDPEVEDFKAKMELFFEKYAGKVTKNSDNSGYGYFCRKSAEGRAYFFNFAELLSEYDVIGEPQGGPAGIRGQAAVSTFNPSLLKVRGVYTLENGNEEYVVVFNETKNMNPSRSGGYRRGYDSYDYLFLAISRKKLNV